MIRKYPLSPFGVVSCAVPQHQEILVAVDDMKFGGPDEGNGLGLLSRAFRFRTDEERNTFLKCLSKSGAHDWHCSKLKGLPFCSEWRAILELLDQLDTFISSIHRYDSQMPENEVLRLETNSQEGWKAFSSWLDLNKRFWPTLQNKQSLLLKLLIYNVTYEIRRRDWVRKGDTITFLIDRMDYLSDHGLENQGHPKGAEELRGLFEAQFDDGVGCRGFIVHRNFPGVEKSVSKIDTLGLIGLVDSEAWMHRRVMTTKLDSGKCLQQLWRAQLESQPGFDAGIAAMEKRERPEVAKVIKTYFYDHLLSWLKNGKAFYPGVQ